jgi:hypothetical protein
VGVSNVDHIDDDHTHQKIPNDARRRPQKAVYDCQDVVKGWTVEGSENVPVHLLIPLSSTLKTNTAPLLIIVLRSESLRRRVMRGMTPWRAAWINRNALTVVSTYPVNGGTSGLLVI